MGYIRPTTEFNVGKKGEYKETWALSGKPKCIEHYTEKGEKTGRWQEWDENEKLVREEN